MTIAKLPKFKKGLYDNIATEFFYSFSKFLRHDKRFGNKLLYFKGITKDYTKLFVDYIIDKYLNKDIKVAIGLDNHFYTQLSREKS